MSHFTTIQTQIRDLDALRDACAELGLTLVPDANCRGYSPLQTWWIGACRPKILGRLEAGLEKLTAADRKAGYRKEDVVRNGIPALFLVPAA